MGDDEARAGEAGEEGGGMNRRAFLAKMAAIAFAAPVISSFTLDAPAFGDSDHPRSLTGNMHYLPNQPFFGNMPFFGNQPFFPNQFPHHHRHRHDDR